MRLLLPLALLLSGCAGWFAERVPLTAAPVELSGTAFFPQEDYHCGPAALATVLSASGVDTHPDRLAAALYIPDRRGTLQVELLAAARGSGRVAVELEATPALIVEQLQVGRPVLVLQNLASRLVPVWHYAVVVGYLPDVDRFVLRSGTDERLLTSPGRLDATLDRAGRWALVALDPGASPLAVPAPAYLKAAADLENVGAHAAALQAFNTARQAWPDDATARLGEANNLYYLGRFEAAAGAYRRLVDRYPDQAVAVHNLTMLLLELGRACEARDLVAGSALEGALMDSARRAAAAADSVCASSAAFNIPGDSRTTR